MAANLSAQDLQHRDLPEYLKQQLERWAVPAHRFTLEVSETSDESDSVRRVLGELRALGLELSIDDFGTSYSSLSMLQRLSLSELMIDQTLIRPLAMADGSERLAAIVRATTDMGHALDLRVVCEGVESAAVADQLQAWGCDVLQGYWLSRPLPADALVA